MEINDLRVQKYNKIAHLNSISNPQIFSSLRIVDKLNYARNINCFRVIQPNGRNNQLYTTSQPPHKLIEQTPFLKTAPKILYLIGQPQSVIIQQRINFRLNQYLNLYEQNNQIPYLQQKQCHRILLQVCESLQNYLQYNLKYTNITPKNVVIGYDNKWELSVVGYLLEVDKNSQQYSIKQIVQAQNRITFALGCLLFKLVFGFSPINQNNHNKFNGFKVDTYLKMLQNENNQKLLKVFYYVQRLLQLSKQCIKLLQQSLTGRMSFKDFITHRYFTNQFNYNNQKINAKNKQISMINSVQPNQLSLIMSAIDYKKKNPLQKLNQKQLPSINQPLLSQAINSLQKNNNFRYIGISQQLDKKSSKVSASLIQQQNHGPIQIQYFGNNQFDPSIDYPCRQLIKYIQNQTQKTQNNNNKTDYQSQLKLYGYPYAMYYQLLKVQRQQSIPIQRKIQKTKDLFMQLSAMNYNKSFTPLHHNQTHFKQFQDIKQNYRENINQLYQYFLNQAMRNYNTKSDSISMIEKAKKKQKGLEYYRLCLKLLEASLLMRKGGNQLNLARIQTSQRKQIQNDLTELLYKYFPKKPEIY